jgi:hypothetical protein
VLGKFMLETFQIKAEKVSFPGEAEVVFWSVRNSSVSHGNAKLIDLLSRAPGITVPLMAVCRGARR